MEEIKDMPKGFTTRAISSRASTLREDDRSVEFTISTETPADVIDWDRLEIVSEILVQSGMELPGNKQVPFLDAHSRYSVADVLGSMREFKTENAATAARAYFSRKQKAFDAYQDVRDGHITDCSVGYIVTESVWIPEGQKQIIGNREYVGPVKVSTRWQLREVSLVPIGADPLAKARAAIKQSEINSAEAIRAEKIMEGKTMEPEKTPVVTATPPASPAIDLEAVRAEAVKTERERIASITALCARHGCSDIAENLTKEGVTYDAAKDAVLLHLEKKQATTAPDARVEPVSDARDKFRAAAIDGILKRSGTKISKPAAGHEDFARMSLLRIAEESLRSAGISTRGMTAMDIAGIALGLTKRGAYPIVGSSSDFTNILYDAANKTIQQEYQEADRTWSIWCKVASAPDFKTIHRPQFSESSDLAKINENGEYTEAKFSDKAESYSIATYGKRFTISRQAIINDDMGAFSRIPRAFGAAAQRLIESLVYGILTTNGNMNDAKALFVADHSNLVSGEAFAQDGKAIQRMMSAMRTQKGFGENTVPLGIMPKFVIVPTALEFLADVAVSSASNTSSEANSGVKNPLSNKGLAVVATPFLDASSTTIAYMAAGNGFDTIEVAFLDGNQSPTLEELDQTDVDGRIYKVRIDVGAKALDWRGLVKHSGS